MRIPQRRSSLASFALGLVIVSVLAALVALALTAGGIQAQTTVPAAPTGLAGSVSHDSVALSWDDPGDDSIAGYQVLRRSRDGDEYGDGEGAAAFVAVVDDTGSPAAFHTDTSVTSRTRYVYRVKAINAVGLSERSSYLNVETLAAASAPAKPSGLAGSVSHDSVALSWDDPGDDSITGYRVLRRSRDGDEYGDGQGAAGFVAIVDDTGSSSASYTDTSVTAQTRYVYRVKARNSAGLSPRSGYVNVETSAAPAPLRQAVPSQPTGLAASTVLENSVTFAWDDPGDSSVTHYQVLRRVGDSGSFTTIEENTGSGATTYTDTTVAADTGYEYRVIAENDNGASPESDRLSVSTPPEATATVVEVPPEEPEEPAIAEEQHEQNLIDRGALAVLARGQVASYLFGTIESPADLHRYQVELEADKFYKFHICGCYTNETGFSKRQLLLMDSEGNPVQDNGKDVVSAPHAKWSGTYIYFAPATGGTYLLDVRASDDQQTGDYALRARDITIDESSDDEGSGSSNDFKWHNVALLYPFEFADDEVSGKLNADGEAGGGVVDEDYFSANLHAGRSYTFRFAASSVSRTSASVAWLVTRIYGPGNYYKVSFSGNTSGGSKTLTATFTANRTGSYVFQIHLQQATGNYEVRVTEN